MRNHTSLKPDHGERLAGQTAAKADHKNSEMGNQHSFAFFDLLHAAFNNDSVSTEAHIYVMHRYAVMHSACQIIPTLFWLGFRTVACCCGSSASESQLVSLEGPKCRISRRFGPLARGSKQHFHHYGKKAYDFTMI